MLVNIDICGDILVQAETDFERDYVRQFEGCSYSAFVKCGLTPAEVIGLKLRKTSDVAELAATTANSAMVPCLVCKPMYKCTQGFSGKCRCIPCMLAQHQ